MRRLREIYTFLLLLIWALNPVIGQQIHLQLKAENKKEDSIINSLGYRNSFIDFSALENELSQLADSLNQMGYVDYRLDRLEKENDTLYIGQAHLGPRINELHIYTDDALILAYAKKLRLRSTSKYFNIDPAETQRIFGRFVQLEAEAGYPLTYFQLENLNRNGNHLDAHLSHNRELRRTVDEIVVKGYEKYPKSFLKHYANLKTGMPYSQTKVIKRTQQLGQLPFLNINREPEILFTQDSTRLYLYLEKNDANRFEGFLGFGTDENTGKLRFDGNLDLALVNNLNFGESLEINYKSDGNDRQHLQVAAELPFLFGSPVGVNLALNLFRQDSTFSTNTQRAQLTYILGTRSRLRAGATFENSTNLLDDTTEAPSQLADYKKSLFGVGYGLAPRVGNRLLGIMSEAQLYASIGKKEANQAKEDQLAIEFDASYTFTLSQRQQIYLANSTKSLSSDTYLTNELFRFGGNKSIRGFQENALLANLYSVFRTEYRYIPTGNLYVHTVFDAAYFENPIIQNEGYLYSFGLGAGILTNAGVLNFSIANGLQEDQQFRFSDSIVHLKFTAIF